jgi:DNA repair protein RadA
MVDDVEKIKEAMESEEVVSEKNTKKKKKKEEEKEEVKITDIPGIGPGTAAKLEAAGIYDLMGLAVMGPSELAELAGLGEAAARKAIQAARKMMDLGFSNAFDYAEKRKEIGYVTSGSKNLDNLLGGKGIETKSITEAYGAFGSGKTQLGLALSVNVQLPLEQGGLNGKAVYIDTEGTFRPERIRQLAERYGANSDKVLKNILVARAFNSDHQILLLDKITEMIKEGEPIRIIIVDSLTAHFRAEFAGRGMLADRQQRLNRYLHNLLKLGEQHNVAIYVTNQVMSDPAQMFGDPTKAVGGNIVAHACLTGDSLIQLSDGSIKEIKSMGQEEVVSGKFSELELENSKSDLVFVNKDVKKIYNIKTNSQIDCSPLHRFFTIDNFSIVEKEAKDLREGEFVMQAGKIEIKGEDQNLPLMNVKRIAKISAEDAFRIKEELEENSITRHEICEKIGITPRQFRRVLNQNWSTSVEVVENLQNCFGGKMQLNILSAQSYKHRNLEMPSIMSPELGQIFGYFLGDGNFEERGLRFRDERVEVLQRYNSFFKGVFNVEGKISKINGKNCYNLDINSKEISEFFKMIAPSIFNYVGRSKEEVVCGFIRGFVDAEGHIDKKRPTITIVQKEKQILKYVQLFLLRLGIRSTIKFDIGRKKISVLRISDRDVKGYCKVGFSAGDKQKRLIECVRKCDESYEKEMMPIRRSDVWDLLKQAGLFPSKVIKARGKSYLWINKAELEKVFNVLMNLRIKDSQIRQKVEFIRKILNSDIRFEKIREIKTRGNESKELFFDFSVPENNNYVANGFVVHNSTYRVYLRRGKKDTRVAKLIDSPNLPDSETVFMVDTQGLEDVDLD